MVSRERKLDFHINRCPSMSSYQYRESLGRKFEEEYFRKLEEIEYQERVKRQEMARPGFTVVRRSDGRLTSVPVQSSSDDTVPVQSSSDDTKENTPTEPSKSETAAAQPPPTVLHGKLISQIKKMGS